MMRKSKPPIALYSALADATRCRIVEILLSGPIPVHALADAFTISRPAISRHLRVLKTAGLVAEVKKGRENLYALRPAKLSLATAWLATISAPAEPGENALVTAAAEKAPAAVIKKVKARTDPVARTQTSETRPVEVDLAVSAPVAEPAATVKSEKLARPIKVEPAVNQMGFDF